MVHGPSGHDVAVSVVLEKGTYFEAKVTRSAKVILWQASGTDNVRAETSSWFNIFSKLT